jgi:transposase
MSQHNPNILYVGLDVAKRSLQLHLAGHFHSLTNDAKGHTQLRKRLRAQPHAHVVCEATGGYEQAVVRVLQAAAIPVSLVEAGRVRYFARAQGQRAKTDPIDAVVLSAYGATFQPRSTPPVSPQQQQLADLTQRRHQLLPTAGHRTQPRRTLCRCLPPAPVAATRQSPGKTNRTM